MASVTEFSFRTRHHSLRRFKKESFDLLVVGGGITGAAVARDASTRGLSVALVDKGDFAWGTSSRSSKLVHGGLRYLENLEFGLVFEALSERTKLLKSVPHLVQPIPFYFPVYESDAVGAGTLNAGMWLYDMLALFRAPGFHKKLSPSELSKELPSLKTGGLEGGFRYFDARMWDDRLAVEILRASSELGAAIANYVEAVAPSWDGDRISGFRMRDRLGGDEIEIRASNTLLCVGPWTDQMGEKLSPGWKNWLSPSKGIHLVFDAKRIPLPGAVVMTNPKDGRIGFVIPRPDYGDGVVVVGTTDGPTDANPEKARIDKADVDYLLDLLNDHFPDLKLSTDDIVSAYVGVRPLMGEMGTLGSEGQTHSKKKKGLQKVSREHFIGNGPGGVVIVAGGKYTTHRTMAEEIVDFTLEQWKRDAHLGMKRNLPAGLMGSATREAPNPRVLEGEVRRAKNLAKERGLEVPEVLWQLYGAEALEIVESRSEKDDPPGFPNLAGQLRFQIRNGMVLRLEDFFLRRVPLYLSRKDHGVPWVEMLAKVWGEEMEIPEPGVAKEIEALQKELQRRSAWLERLDSKSPGSQLGSSYSGDATRP